MALIPASILIVYLVGVLMYLLTRCCDRKSRQQSNGCQKCTLIFFSIICAIAVGAGKRLSIYLSSIARDQHVNVRKNARVM